MSSVSVFETLAVLIFKEKKRVIDQEAERSFGRLTLSKREMRQVSTLESQTELLAS